ncbi:MAG: hypothetical protein HN445_05835 [Bacteroidetes Order II. Incertae sedis bacterium]|nr:hypothetical protein [Bacteroidetes Order II. bacterium]MBT5248668.1 hypothetical protein [Bacteroidetes Order II. bacterium]MBT6200447.1 hypothetical protein [Bacteroidetes Order II. bacterium]MBT6582626.1 hypothetical protein [Bacteroidetes Order II. bacterium]
MSMFKYSTKSEYILGVSVSSRKVEAVLVHDAPSGPMVLRTFVRKRAGQDLFAGMMGPDVSSSSDDASFSISTGNESDSSSVFLASEFGSVNSESAAVFEREAAPTQFATPCDLELLDILSECLDAGYENVQVAFALSSEYLGTTLLKESFEGVKQSDKKKKKKKKGKGAEKDRLFTLLGAAQTASFSEKKTSFIPLGSVNQSNGHLAVFALGTEPITGSIETIRNRKRPFPNISFMDTEVTLMLALVRAALLTQGSEVDDVTTGNAATVFVRVGAEDTFVMFLEGDKLVHFESIRSITTFDPSETICSRILLMHDEYGEGDAQNMMLFSEAGEASLLDGLSLFFPQTKITLLRDSLPELEEERAAGIDQEGMLAMASAFRLVKDEIYEDVFSDVDFMNPKLKGRKMQLPFSWPIAAMIILLFGSTLFFVQRYFTQSHQIEMTRFELSQFPEEMISEDASVLQMKIDSLLSRSNGMVDALGLLDSLLVGSDVWSRALERTSVNTADISGLWIERWEENEPGELEISGTSVDRGQIVEFASKSGANITSLEFDNIRDWPVYTFHMTMEMSREVPEAAIYLIENIVEIMSDKADLEALEAPSIANATQTD